LLIDRAKLDTVTRLSWCEGTKISHRYWFDLANKFRGNTIPHTASELIWQFIQEAYSVLSRGDRGSAVKFVVAFKAGLLSMQELEEYHCEEEVER
jgi:hypothetical protein